MFILDHRGKEKVWNWFKKKNILVKYLDDNQLFYVLNCNSTKAMWDTLEMIYIDVRSVKQGWMSTRGKKMNALFIKVSP